MENKLEQFEKYKSNEYNKERERVSNLQLTSFLTKDINKSLLSNQEELLQERKIQVKLEKSNNLKELEEKVREIMEEIKSNNEPFNSDLDKLYQNLLLEQDVINVHIGEYIKIMEKYSEEVLISEEDKQLFENLEKKLWEDFREYKELLREKETLKKKREKISSRLEGMKEQGNHDLKILKTSLESNKSTIKENDKKIKELLNSNPSMWFVHHLRNLRKNHGALRKGKLVEFPSVSEKVQRIKENILLSKPTAIWGHTGTGKTAIAKQVANEIYKELYPDNANGDGNYYLVSGEKEIDSSVFFGSNQLIGADRTSFVDGPLLKAMKEGKVLIIDEANLIPTNVIGSLNDALTVKPGNRFTYSRDSHELTVEVKKGFNVIMTGNIDKNHNNENYNNRVKLDSATLNRLDSIDYDYLLQTTDKNLKEGVKEGAEKNELFHFMLLKIMDRYGRINEIPKGSIRKLWIFARRCRSLQDNFAGKRDLKLEEEYYNTKFALSNRNIIDVLEEWERDNYSHQLDYFVEKKIIESITTNPTDKKFVRGFFGDLEGLFRDGYEKDVDKRNVESFNQRQVVEYMFGDKPKYTWEDVHSFEIINKIINDESGLILRPYDLSENELAALNEKKDEKSHEAFSGKLEEEIEKIKAGIENQFAKIGCR